MRNWSQEEKTMPTINCKDCGNVVSQAAASCPHCGAPQSNRVQTIEKTSKSIKLGMLLGKIVLAFALWNRVLHPDDIAMCSTAKNVLFRRVPPVVWHHEWKIANEP